MTPVDHLYGEVLYLRGDAGTVLRYRLPTGDCESSLHERVKSDVLRRQDPSSCDLYVYGTYVTADGMEAQGLCAISTDNEHRVTGLRVVLP